VLEEYAQASRRQIDICRLVAEQGWFPSPSQPNRASAVVFCREKVAAKQHGDGSKAKALKSQPVRLVADVRCRNKSPIEGVSECVQSSIGRESMRASSSGLLLLMLLLGFNRLIFFVIKK
jgi:hypothetical protein